MDNNKLFYKNLIEFLMHLKHRLYEVAIINDLSAMQLIMILILEKHKSQSMNYFKKLFNCDASNITNIAEALVSKGLISRLESTEDRRIKELKLLPKGDKVQDKILKDLKTPNPETFFDLEKEQIVQLIDFVNNWH